MSGGILGMFSPQGQGNGLLGDLNQGVTDNSDSLVGLGLGLMSGSMNTAAEGYMSGQRADTLRRQQKLLQDQEMQKRTAAQAMVQKYNIPAELATDPDSVFAMAKSIEMQKRTPKELSFEQQQFNRLNPAQQEQYRQQKFLGGGSDIDANTEARKRQAAANGMTPDHPAYQSFVLTGKMPREDQAPLSATDKKAIMEADEGVMAGENAVASLRRARELSDTAYDGPTAGIRGTVTGAFGSPEGQATTQLDNEVKSNALMSMKAIFGANPTEGERAILLEIQGASNQPKAVRDKIYERGLALAERRLQFNRERAQQLRGGEYYKPGSQGAGQATQGGVPNATPPGRMKFDENGNPIR